MLLINNPELLASFRQGERSALEAVYRHYVKGVAHFLQKGFSFRSGDKFFFFKGYRSTFDLHNAVQEVFRRAFEEKARLSYNGVNSYSNWILAIARNMVINQFRNKEVPFSQFEEGPDGENRRRFENEIDEKYTGLLYASTGPKQDVAIEHAELKILINRFLGELNDEDRELINLRFVEGFGQEEAAKHMGSTRMKIRTQEAKVRKRLIAFMRDSGYLDQFAKQIANT